MYVIKKMQLNKFQPRPIVSNRELFMSMGEKPATINSKETSDCFNSPSVEGATKTKMLGLAAEISKVAFEKHQSNGEASSLPNINARDY